MTKGVFAFKWALGILFLLIVLAKQLHKERNHLFQMEITLLQDIISLPSMHEWKRWHQIHLEAQQSKAKAYLIQKKKRERLFAILCKLVSHC